MQPNKHKRICVSPAVKEDIEILEIGVPVDDDEIIGCEIAGFQVEMLIDSGASINAITETVFKSLLEEPYRSRVNKIESVTSKPLVAYATKTPLVVIAQIEADLWIDDNHPNGIETFFVIKGAGRSLLGRKTAVRYQVLQLGLKVTKQAMEQAQVNMVDRSSQGEEFEPQVRGKSTRARKLPSKFNDCHLYNVFG